MSVDFNPFAEFEREFSSFQQENFETKTPEMKEKAEVEPLKEYEPHRPEMGQSPEISEVKFELKAGNEVEPFRPEYASHPLEMEKPFRHAQPEMSPKDITLPDELNPEPLGIEPFSASRKKSGIGMDFDLEVL